MQASTGQGGSTRQFLLCVALLWLAGNGLRITILAVPPVIPLIRLDLGMSETQVGILTGLPPVLFACTAVLGSLLIARFGAVKTLLAGLFATAAGSALRGAAPDIWFLYAATIVTGFGVAIMHPSLPPLVRSWTPQRIGFGTAVFTNGLLVGEILPVALTIPVVLPLLGNSWRASFVLWAVPVVIIALIIMALAPRQPASAQPKAPQRWWPDWRDPLIWRLGVALGSVNSMYFSANAFLPDYLHYLQRPDLVSAALTALNVGQIPASLLLLAVAGRLERAIWPHVVCGAGSLAAIIGIAVLPGPGVVACAAVLGFFAAAILILMLALPPLLAPPDDVHRVSAAMFTISYSCAVITPVFSGLFWDLSGIAQSAFVPLGACAVILMALAPGLRLPRKTGA
ncbi:MAG: transporter, family, cyanate transporter [Hyphomicrobiales bacterium]|nr:transporter, family, cyanate transporter [Hyphomicrobiales bacterium]